MLLQNLFADSEKQIIRALDRGLLDFSEGRVSDVGIGQHPNVAAAAAAAAKRKSATAKKSAEEQAQAETEWIDEYIEDYVDTNTGDDNQSPLTAAPTYKSSNNNEILDVEFSRIEKDTKEEEKTTTTTNSNPKTGNLSQQQQAALNSMRGQGGGTAAAAANDNNTLPKENVDFAVLAAKQALKKKEIDGFAVVAARKAAALKKSLEKETPKKSPP
jgi:hypothetical protein